MPTVNGEVIEHVIYDCAERVLLHGDVYVQLVPVTKENWQQLKDEVCPGQNLHKPLTDENCIGIFCVKQNGDFIQNGCITVLDGGVFYILKGLNDRALSFIAKDDEGRIKVVR